MEADLTEFCVDDGYRLTYGGYDYLALYALTRSDAVVQLGSTMGVGKESDILLVTSPSPDGSGEPIQAVLKIHRLGRTSFRTVANNRAYLGKRSHTSWQYMSRLSAQREFLAMRSLYDAGLRVPRPIGNSRHAVVMSLVPGMPLRAVPLSAFGRGRKDQERRVSALYAELIEIVLDYAGRGIIHGDMNEFNIMLEGVRLEQERIDDMIEDDYEEQTALEDEECSAHTKLGEDGGAESLLEEDPGNDGVEEAPEDLNIIPHIIDFPQITSMSHPQASEYFDRDVNGIKAFFRKKYHFESQDGGPTFSDATARLAAAPSKGIKRLDGAVEAAGFDKKTTKQAGQEIKAQSAPNANESEAGTNISTEVSADGSNDLGSMTQRVHHMKVESSGRQKVAAGWSL